MKHVLSALLLLLSVTAHSQTIQRTVTLNETFENNTNGWATVNLNNSGYETFVSTQKRYFCHLPLNNSMGWNWTWVALPKILTQKIDNEKSVEMEMDFQVPQYGTNGYQFAFMFDTYNVTNQCAGGDFRAIWINGNNSTVRARFTQTENCNSGTKWAVQGNSTYAQTTNKLKLVKNGVAWTLFINGANVLSFNYQGSLNLTHLNFGRGQFIFDNIKITKSSLVIAPPVNNNTNNNTVPANNNNNSASAGATIPNNKTPKIWILLAGIEKYKDGPLSYTVDDINAMYNFWTSAKGGKIPKSQIVYLADENATTANIIKQAGNLFSKASENDVIITFLSGHGSTGNFVTYNGYLQYEYLNQIMNKSKAKKKICFVDACHSGSMNNKSVLKSRGTALSENEALNLFYTSMQSAGSGIGYVLSCRADELSREYPNFGHGLFTYHLLNGLKGPADKDKNRLVTIGELYDYIKVKVPEDQFDQNPVIKGTYDPDTPVSVY